MDEHNESSTPVTSPPDGSTSASQPSQPAPGVPQPQVQTPETASPPPATPVTPPPSTPPVSTTPSAPPPSPQQPQKRRFPWIFLLILLFIGFLGVAMWYFRAQLQKTTAPAPTPAQSAMSASPQVLVIGTDPTYPPMEFIQKGKMVGYDIDLANLLAKQLGVKVEFKKITFDNLFTALDQKQIDAVIAAVTITTQRQKKYDFSEGYLNAGEVIITQKTNNAIKKTADLKGKKIGVQKGTTLETEALKYTPDNFVIRYPDFVQATKALVNGQVDAIITDLTDAQGIISDNPTLKIASDPFTNDYYGVVFRKGDPEVAKVNSALDSLRVRGYLTDLKHKWLD